VGPGMTGSADSQVGARVYPILDLQVGTEISRTFGEGADRWRHTIDPKLDLRAIPAQGFAGTVPPLWLSPGMGIPIQDHYTGSTVGYTQPLPYDAIDFAAGYSYPSQAPGNSPAIQSGATPGGLAQGDLHLEQTLRSVRGQRFSLDVGEYFDGAGPEATYARFAFADGPVRGSAFGSYQNHPNPCPPLSACDPGPSAASSGAERLRRLAEAGAVLGVNDSRGDVLQGTFYRAIAAGAPRLSAPLDALFAQPLPQDDPRWALPDISQASLFGNVRVAGPLNVHASISYLPPANLVNQLTMGASYVSPQHCLTIDATGVVQPPTAGQPLGLAAFFLTWNLGELAGGGGTGY
jgi:hypothetical protein